MFIVTEARLIVTSTGSALETWMRAPGNKVRRDTTRMSQRADTVTEPLMMSLRDRVYKNDFFNKTLGLSVCVRVVGVVLRLCFFGAGGGIRTHEPLRDEVLSLAPLTRLGDPRAYVTSPAPRVSLKRLCVFQPPKG